MHFNYNFRILMTVLAITMPSGLVINPAYAEDCYLDLDNDDAGDNTGNAFSNGADTRLACGRNAIATGQVSTAVGTSATATGAQSTAVGYVAEATGIQSTAVGYIAQATGNQSTVLGISADATAQGSIALGYFAQATGLRSIAVGLGTEADSEGAVTLGNGARINASNSPAAIAIGYSSQVGTSAPGGIAIGGDVDGDGVGAQSLAPNAVAIGADTIADDPDTVFFGYPVRVVPNDTTNKERVLARLENNGGVNFKLNDTSGGDGEWTFRTGSQGGKFVIGKTGSGVQVFQVFSGGNVAIAGTLTQSSSRTKKENIEDVDHQEILAKVTQLPIREWNYIHDQDYIKHIGPMAEDFHSLFDVGQGPKTLSTLDTSGIALAAIQALQQQKDKEVEELNQQLDERDNQIAGLIHTVRKNEKLISALISTAIHLRKQQSLLQQHVANLSGKLTSSIITVAARND